MCPTRSFTAQIAGTAAIRTHTKNARPQKIVMMRKSLFAYL